MRRLCTLAILSFASALAPVSAQQAAACDPSPNFMADTAAGSRLRQLIKDKQFAAVDDEIGDKLKRQERGEYSDLGIFRDVAEATKADAAMEPLLAQWVAERPKSFVARLFKGEHHKSMGYSKRGSQFAEQTSAEQFAAMEAEFKKSMQEFKEAMDLRPASALPHAMLIGLARAMGGTEDLRGLVLQAEKLDPHNLAARRAAVWALAPKWGGSFEEMDALVDRAGKSGLDPTRLRFLRYETNLAKADHFAVVTKEKTQEIAYYRKALEHCNGVRAWRGIAAAAYVLEDWKAVRDANTQVLYAEPGAAAAVQRRGWANEKLGDMPAALKDYDAAAELGEAWAQNRLGYMLMMGQHGPKDLARAKRLLESSAAKGNTNARVNLEWLNRQPPSN